MRNLDRVRARRHVLMPRMSGRGSRSGGIDAYIRHNAIGALGTFPNPRLLLTLLASHIPHAMAAAPGQDAKDKVYTEGLHASPGMTQRVWVG